MRLEGWNHVPAGYGASFDVHPAPLWLRIWFRIPFVDRWAYPELVRRGHGYLTPHPGVPPEERDEVAQGWRLRPTSHEPPGSVTDLR